VRQVKPLEVTDRRTLSQNDKMWAMLADLASQVPWTVNGVKALIGPDDWKDIMTAGLTKNQRVAEGVEGGWVLLGERTHKYSKVKMSDLIEFMFAFGATRNVKWSEEVTTDVSEL
jgi:hypothetical protein